jgi:hypothetical protein
MVIGCKKHTKNVSEIFNILKELAPQQDDEM